LNDTFESHISVTRDFDAREQVTEKTKENIPILRDDLGSVEIS
jgi:hypothetical protein